MHRFTLVGLLPERDAVLLALQRLGAVEIEDGTTREEVRLAAQTSETGEARNARSAVQMSEAQVARLSGLLTESVRILPGKKAMFSIRRKVAKSDFEAAAAREAAIDASAGRLEASLQQAAHLRGQRMRLTSALDVLDFWRDVDLDLSTDGTARVRFWAGTMTGGDRFDEFRATLAERHPANHLVVLPPTVSSVAPPSRGVPEVVRFLVAVLREEEDDVRALLKSHGFVQIPAHGESGTPAQVCARLSAELEAVERGIATAEAECLALARASRDDFEILHDLWLMRLEHARAVAQVGTTGRTFLAVGWVPEKLGAQVEQALRSRFSIAVAMRTPLKGEEFPVLLKNHPLVRPYEVITEMFSTPSTGEIDPNPLLAPFFFLLFGLMLGDAGYGLLLMVGCAALVWGVGVQGNLRRMCLLFIQGSVAAVVSGFLFGSFFGDIVTVASQGRAAFPVVWFDPLTDPIRMLAFSMILGLLHVFTGMGAKAYILILRGQWIDAVLDVGSWFILIVGLGLLVVGGILGTVGLVLAVTGAATIVLFSARDSRKPPIRIFKGLYNLYGITGYFGDILSYSRIMALGLAGGVIAMVVNKMGSIAGFGWTGILVFLVVAVFGHALNLALSTLGAYVHTSRLQYVEFFGKFYEGGGRPWAPLKSRTKYIEII